MKAAAAILLFLLAYGEVLAQDFTRFYLDSAEIQTGRHLLQGQNQNLWLAGTRGNSGGNTRAWLYHLNGQGDLLHKYSFPGTQSQVWVGMDTCLGGIAAVVGLQEFNGETRYNLAFCRNDSLLSWTPLPELDNAVLDDARLASNGRMLVCGFRSSPGIAGNDFFLASIRIDSASTDWVFQDGYGPNDHIGMGLGLSDGSVLFSGTVSDQGNYNPCMGKLDADGNLLWLNVVSTEWNDGSQKFTLAENGDIWLVGESSTSAGSFFDTEIFRFNQDGELLWQQWLGSTGQDAAFLIQRKTLSPGFWVAGYSNAGSNGAGPISPFIMSLDENGNSLGEAFWNMNAPSPVYSMLARGDSVFHFCGISNNQAYLMKRTRPQLHPVFTVKNRALLSGNQAPAYADLLREIREEKVHSIRAFDLFGRLIFENPGGNNWQEFAAGFNGLAIVRVSYSSGLTGVFCLRLSPP